MILHARQFGALPREVIYPPRDPQVENALMALATVLGGVGAALGIVLVAQGRAKDVYPFAIATTVTGAVLAAVKVLGDEG